MSTTARLGIDALDLDDAERVARHDTTLVEAEAMLTLGLGLIHEALVNGVAFVDDAIRSVLNLLLLVTSQGLEVCDVNMGLPLGLLSTSLPDVRAEDLTARSKDDMGASVMGHELMAADRVN